MATANVDQPRPGSPPCFCRGYDPADPCGHGDTSADCPRHDPIARSDWIAEQVDIMNATGA